MKKGVIDRFEENLAVILIEAEKKELIIDVAKLPEGAKPGIWLKLKQLENEEWLIEIDLETTEVESNKTSDLLSKLRAKSKVSKFKK